MKIRYATVALTAATTAGLALSACGSSDDSAEDQTTSSGDLTVAASFYPLAFVTERVAGDNATVANLTQSGGEPHDLELTGQQVGEVSDADLVVYLHGFQPSVDEAVEQNAQDKALDVAELVELLPGHEEDEHSEEDEHADEHAEEDEHEHGDLEGDPHIWLDPANMETIAESVADRLADVDADNADMYHGNADELVGELQVLNDEFTAGLAQCQQKVIVVSHEAYGYLAQRYGLEQVGISGLDPEAEPSPERVAEVHDVIAAEGVTTIFYERLVSPEVAETIASDLDVETAVLDPIEGLTNDTENEDYFSLMRANLETLKTANGCG